MPVPTRQGISVPIPPGLAVTDTRIAVGFCIRTSVEQRGRSVSPTLGPLINYLKSFLTSDSESRGFSLVYFGSFKAPVGWLHSNPH